MPLLGRNYLYPKYNSVVVGGLLFADDFVGFVTWPRAYSLINPRRACAGGLGYFSCVCVSVCLQASSQAGAKGAYAPPPFACDACRRPTTQPASACARGRTRDSHAFFFSAHKLTVRFVKESTPHFGPWLRACRLTT